MLELSNATELRRQEPLSWFRATRKDNGATVILKVVDISELPTEDVEAFQQKISAVHQLNDLPEVHSWTIEHQSGKLQLVTEDSTGTTLRELLKSAGPLNLADFLNITTSIAQSLSRLHERQVVLCNLSPDSVLVDKNDFSSRFFDLDAALIAEQQPIATDFGGAQLEYLSPEQTGRTKHQVQASSDLYSLGILMYECLSGAPPFTSSDPLELSHGHIAVEPKLLVDVEPGVPDVISAITDKLLAKEPSERYLSAKGLFEDLSRCRTMLAQQGEITWFDIAEMDEHSRVSIPERLYGRSAQLNLLHSLWEKTQEGSAEFLFVEGPSGIGKTTLIETVADRVKARGQGSFVSGKFDQLFNVPYKAFFECFTALVRQLLAQDPERLEHLRPELLQALSGSGRLLIEAVPDLETVLGEQPALEDLPPTERENRFKLICRQFFQVFASKDHPLTVFVDDLQWADAASLNLIEYLISDPGSSYIYFIGAHRPQGSAALSALKASIANLGQANIHHLALTPLGREDVVQLLMDTFGVPKTELVDELVEICLEKTQGNPFFLRQFLLKLDEDSLIGFDFASNRWEWQNDEIKQLSIHEDVALLFAERLQMLPPDVLDLVQWGACLGNRFEIETIAKIKDVPAEDIRAGLKYVIRQGLLLEANPHRLDKKRAPAAEAATLEFAHDRILEAVYASLTEDAQSRRHFKIGTLLDDQIRSGGSDESVFSALNQLIRGFAHINEHPSPQKIAELFLSGAQKAKSKASYELGLAYLKHGLELLPAGSWNSDYNLAYRFHLEQMESEYLNGNFHAADKLFDILKKNSRTTIEKLTAYNLNVQMLTYMTKFSEAIASGIEGLKLNGINIASPFLPTFLAEVIKAKRSVKRLGVENISNLQALDNQEVEKSLEIMNSLATPTFLTDKNRFIINGLKMFNLTMKHGMSVYGPNSVMMYGVVNSAAFSNFDAAYDIAVPAMQLARDHNTSSLGRGRIFFVEGMLINWLKRPLSESIDLFEKGLAYSWASADLAYVGYHYFGILRALFSSGAPLRQIKSKLQEFEPEALRLRSDELTTTVQTFERYLFHATSDQGELSLTEEDLDLESSMVSDQGIGVFCLCFSHLATVFDDPELNARLLTKLEGMDEYVTTGFYYVDYLFQYALHLSRTIQSTDSSERRKQKRKLKKLFAKLHKIAMAADDAQSHKAMLVSAEVQRLSGNFDLAMTRYDEAISIAKKNRSYDVAAIAAERAAEANLERGHRTAASSYLSDAIATYQNWGATAKVAQLRNQHGDLIDSRIEQAPFERQLSSLQVLSNLDMASVLKASQAISGAIMQDELLQQLLKIVIQNVGAQRGLVLLRNNGELIVEAEGRSDWTEVQKRTRKLRDDGELLDDVPNTVVRYVQRTQAVLVLDNASIETPFSDDAYFKDKPPCSVLCAPILLHGELVGMIYLENALSTGAFTPDRLAVLEILSSQAAISIKNASLYSDMKNLNQAYERFVPRQFIALLEKDSITDVQLADHVQRQMTIMFVDVRDFAAHSEKMDPKENFEFINALLGEMDPIISKYSGFIDKYLGDGIMALFPTGATDAVSCSIEIIRAIELFDDHRQRTGAEPVRIGIGVHTGLMMLGTIGGQDRMDGTVISSAVNLASRLESLTKVYGTSILISGDAFNHLGQDCQKFDIREIDRVNVKGMSESTTVFEVKGTSKEATSAAMPSEFEQGLDLFRQNRFNEARQLFSEALQSNPNDPVAKLYVKRCAENAEESTMSN